MTGSFQASKALLRTLPRLMSRADPVRDQYFQDGYGTRAATQACERQAASVPVERVVKHAKRPRPTEEHREKEIARRRTWAGGGNMPPAVRTAYSEAERAALSVIAEQCKRRGFCALSLDEIARLAGVSRTSVQNALRKARSKQHSHISMRERPQQGGKNLTNIIKITCASWLSWIARAIGFKRLSTSESPVKKPLSESVERPRGAFERDRADRPEGQSHRLLFGSNPGLASSWSGR